MSMTNRLYSVTLLFALVCMHAAVIVVASAVHAAGMGVYEVMTLSVILGAGMAMIRLNNPEMPETRALFEMAFVLSMFATAESLLVYHSLWAYAIVFEVASAGCVFRVQPHDRATTRLPGLDSIATK